MSSRDRYLRAIFVLEQSRRGNPPVTTGEVADALDVHPSSVTEMFGNLESAGLLHHEKYEGATLTDSGREQGRALLENSCILQRFLRDVLDVDEYRAEAQAIEPVLDGDVADRLSLLVDRPETCPACFDQETGRCSRLERD